MNGRLDAEFFRICDARAITLSLPSGAKASVDAPNLSGGNRSDYGRPLRATGVGGRRLRTNIKGGGARIKPHNVNGGITISGPPPARRTC